MTAPHPEPTRAAATDIAYLHAIVHGQPVAQRRAMAKAITLLESTRADQRAQDAGRARQGRRGPGLHEHDPRGPPGREPDDGTADDGDVDPAVRDVALERRTQPRRARVRPRRVVGEHPAHERVGAVGERAHRAQRGQVGGGRAAQGRHAATLAAADVPRGRPRVRDVGWRP